MFSFRAGAILLVNYLCLVRGHFPWYLDLSSILALNLRKYMQEYLSFLFFCATLVLESPCFYRLLFGVRFGPLRAIKFLS